MRNHLLLAIALLTVSVATANAQFGPPTGLAPGASGVRRPTVSPYLNLLRGGNPAVNYAGLVRPEQQIFANQSRLATQIGGINQDVNQLQSAGPFTGLGGDLVTGNTFGFQTQFRYFQTTGRAGGGQGGGQGGFNSVNRGGGVGGGTAGRVGGAASGAIGGSRRR